MTGTKDNKLLLWDAATGRRVEIPLPARKVRRVQQFEACGIHSIATNFTKTLLATGADDPNDAAIFRLPSFEPVQMLENHDDWIFAMEWLTDTVLATGSRDTTVKVWSVDSDGPSTNTQPLVERRDHAGKVRDLKYCAESELLATLGQDSTCKIWDPYDMRVVSNVKLENKRELVCLALNSQLIAVGSQQHITLIDVRCGHISRHILSADEGWGVRSLSFTHNMITCGGGRGRLSFFDLRNDKYIILGHEHKKPGGRTASIYYETGPGHAVSWSPLRAESVSGWLLDVRVFYCPLGSQKPRGSCASSSMEHAIYAHAYDGSGTKLLAAGGPLPCTLRGCYVAVW